MGKHEKNGISTMTKMLIALFITAISYIVACFVFAWHDKVVSDALTHGFFGAITGECGMMGMIRTTRERHENRRWQVEDRKYEAEKNKTEGADRGEDHGQPQFESQEGLYQ